MIVVDANVIVAMVRNTTRTPEARAVHAFDSDWTVPSLWQYEVLSALLNEVKSGHLSLPLAVKAAEIAVHLLGRNVRDFRAEDILASALTTGLTAYDAAYVVLARSLNTVLVTEDKQILRSCPDVARSMREFLSPPDPLLQESKGSYKTKSRNKPLKRKNDLTPTPKNKPSRSLRTSQPLR